VRVWEVARSGSDGVRGQTWRGACVGVCGGAEEMGRGNRKPSVVGRSERWGKGNSSEAE
jgi:hypothetical protein